MSPLKEGEGDEAPQKAVEKADSSQDDKKQPLEEGDEKEGGDNKGSTTRSRARGSNWKKKRLRKRRKEKEKKAEAKGGRSDEEMAHTMPVVRKYGNKGGTKDAKASRKKEREHKVSSGSEKEEEADKARNKEKIPERKEEQSMGEGGEVKEDGEITADDADSVEEDERSDILSLEDVGEGEDSDPNYQPPNEGVVGNDLVMMDGELETMEQEKEREEARRGREEDSEEASDEVKKDPNYEITDLAGHPTIPKKKSVQGGARVMTSYFRRLLDTGAGNITPPEKEKRPRTPSTREKARSRSRSPKASELSSEGRGTDRPSSGGEESGSLL